MEPFEHIVTIISYEEFNELVDIAGHDEIIVMELIDAIARINGEIYEQTNSFGQT